jgi:uncharacterized caspase-like protein
VGVNTYPAAPLRFCVYDAEDLVRQLVKTFGFPIADTRLLCDGRATAANIRERLAWVTKADRWTVYQSGHGTQAADRNGDEVDRLDELFCPVDFDWSDPTTWLLDDDYARIFAKAKPGSRGLFISDSCHSGDLVRELGNPMTKHGRIKALQPPADIAWRNRVAREAGLGLRRVGSELPANVVALSACRSDQTSIDGSPFPGRGNGAFTGALLQVLGKTPDAPLEAVIREINALLHPLGYPQEAQLDGDGSQPFLRNG